MIPVGQLAAVALAVFLRWGAPEDSLPGAAQVEEAEAPWRPRLGPNRLHYSNLLGLRLNPEGLLDELDVGYRRMLWQRPGVLFQDTYLDVDAHLFMNPSFMRVGPEIEIVPFAFLVASARYTHAFYWNAFGNLQSFPSARAETGPDAIDAGEQAGDSYATSGHVVTLKARLQGKFRSVALRDEVTAQYSDMDLRSGDRVFYEQTFDVAFPDRGWVLVNDLDLLYVTDFGLVVGARYTMTHAVYRDRHVQDVPGGGSPRPRHHRVGPAVLYTLFERPGARFDKPTIIVLAQWWAAHPYRAGREVHAGWPYLVVAFSFQGQLLPWNRRHPGRRLREI